MSSNLPDRFDLVPQKLVYGGSALGHHAGRPVLVPYALPGERVRVEAVREAKGMVYGRLVEVLESASERITPRCPYFGRCGGCHYQHLDAVRQLEIKREILRETLRRVGRVDWQGEIAVHAGEPWCYRNQVQLKIGRPGAGPAGSDTTTVAASGHVGFFAADSHDLVAIDTCPISSPRLNAVIQEFAHPEWRERLAGWSEVELRTDDRDEQVVLAFRGDGDGRHTIDQAIERLAGECRSMLPGVVGVAFEVVAAPANRGGGQAGRATRARPSRPSACDVRVFGNSALNYRVGEFEYGVSPGSFFQSSRLLLTGFVAAVTGKLPGPLGLALDLYAGVGLFTLPLSRIFGQVVAVEANACAAADLAANLGAHGAGNARAAHSTAAEFLRRYAQAAPDLVVLDPPRAGCEAETLHRLAAIGPAQVRYVSCHPPTLARDLALLVRHGYGIERVELFDLFPQTFHIETMVTLRRASREPGFAP